MIPKAALTLTAKHFCSWYEDKLPPAGKHTVKLLEARALTLIEDVPAAVAGEFESTLLTEQNVKDALDWILLQLATAYAQDDWAKIATQSLRIVAWMHIKEIHQRIVAPPLNDSNGGLRAVEPHPRPKGK